jgi:nicotinamidase/pyrazinamidase
MSGLIWRDDDVLVVIDAQNDFCPGGTLAVPDGDAIMPVINRLAVEAPHVVLSQDWHPKNQASFASAHGRAPFSTIALEYGEQVLWPDHCVQGSWGAEFHPALRDGALQRAEMILRKGHHPAVDSYSAFFENDRKTSTGLAGWLRECGIRRCVFAGLALDFCVRYSAEDAIAQGFEAAVIIDATRAINLGGSRATALVALAQRGVMLTNLDGSVLQPH